MEDIYQLIENKEVKGFTPEEEFDKEAWATKKQEEREQTYERIDRTCNEVNTDAAIRDGYLDVVAAFPNHSVSNTLLILDQKPEATRIGDVNYWSKQGAIIKKNERAFTILEPGKEYTREDGSIGTFYNNKKVFDVSQTTARTRLPRRFDEHAVLMAIVTKSPIAIRPSDNLGGELAVYDHANQCIHVQKGLSETQLFWALSTELSHATMARGVQAYDREGSANKAELAATVLAKRYGIETVSGETPPPATPDADSQAIREALKDVRQAAKEVSDRVKNVLDKPKEREYEAQR